MRQTEESCSTSTREKILETALKLFSTRGYLGATTREIAKEAGIAEVTLFRHFPSKELLFEAMLTTHSFLPELKVLLPEMKELSYEQALRTIASRFLDALSERRDIIKVMQAEMQRYPEKILAIYHTFIDEVFREMASYFRGMQKMGVLRQFDPDFGARAFMGMFFAYFNAEEILLRKKYRHVDKDATIREYVDIFIAGTINKQAGAGGGLS